MRVGKVPVVPYYRPGDERLAQDLARWRRPTAPFAGQPRAGGDG